MLSEQDQLFAALHLCQALGRRLLEFTADMDSQLDTTIVLNKFGQLKEAWPQAAECLQCDLEHVFPFLFALRNSLAEVHVHEQSMTTNIPNGLADIAAQCTNLRSISLYLDLSRADEFLEPLLSQIGHALRELSLITPNFGKRLNTSRILQCVSVPVL